MQVSAGGLIRGEEGRWLAGYMANLGQCDSLTTETWAIILGLELAWDKGHRRIILETNSLILHNMIKENIQRKRVVPMLHHITEILSRDWVMKIKHCYREANCCSDRLANMGASMELGIHWLDSPLTDFLMLLQADLFGATLPHYGNYS